MTDGIEIKACIGKSSQVFDETFANRVIKSSRNLFIDRCFGFSSRYLTTIEKRSITSTGFILPSALATDILAFIACSKCKTS